LEKRQRELEQIQHSTVTGTPAPVKNWPPCSPILYHDIDAEIPVDLQSTVRRAYQAYLVVPLPYCSGLVQLILGLLLYCAIQFPLSDTVPSTQGQNHRLALRRYSSWLLGLVTISVGIYAVTGIPGAFILWYGRIYNAASYDRSVTFMCFFLGCAIHIGFCIWAAIRIRKSRLFKF